LHLISNSDSWKKFWEYYNQYSEDNLNVTQWIEFKKMLTNLQDHVFCAIFIVVCIINTADTVKLFMIFRLNVIFMNEMIKIIKLNTIIILMHYASASIVMIENHKQLKSTVLSQKNLSQQFIVQIIMSFFT